MCERIKIILAAAVCTLAFTLAAFSAHNANASGGSAYINMELSTGAVLAESNADAELPMASTTKIMTALLVCEDCNPDEVVRVPAEAAGVEGSSIYLKEGEEIDVRDLLYGLMLRSGNDAATALAIAHSGSVQKFVEKMNERAKQLGAENTNFCNPSGLPDDDHYTTARDLCKIACAAMHNQLFRTVAGTRSWHGKYRSYANKNKMLYNYDGATGIKTGYTLKAGRCLVSSAMRNGMEVVCVVLNIYDMYGKSEELLDSCFENYRLNTISREKVFMCGGRPCTLGEDCKLVTKKDAALSYRCLECDKEGGCCGRLNIFDGNNLIFDKNLYSIV